MEKSITGLTIEQAAAGMYRVACNNMAQGVREVTIKRGFDPREFPLIPGGGAGPIHGCLICSELEIPLLVVPRDGLAAEVVEVVHGAGQRDDVGDVGCAGLELGRDARERGLLEVLEHLLDADRPPGREQHGLDHVGDCRGGREVGAEAEQLDDLGARLVQVTEDVVALAAVARVVVLLEIGPWERRRPDAVELGLAVLLQGFADALKLISKEDLRPHNADRWVFEPRRDVMVAALESAVRAASGWLSPSTSMRGSV